MARPFKVGETPPYIPQVVFAQTILKKEILVRGKNQVLLFQLWVRIKMNLKYCFVYDLIKGQTGM